jgi:hypothetical protein
MDPAIVNSATFGQLWKVAFNSKEQVSDHQPSLEESTLEDSAWGSLSAPQTV